MIRGNIPLNALRAFEVSARYLSFTLAAEELNVTQVAVSRQVKVLEEYLEVLLFQRGHRSLTLTEEGKRLLPALSAAFENIYASVGDISMRGRRDIVSVQAYTTFAQRWLIPRLSSFHTRHPNVEVRISASLQQVDFATSNLSAAIRSGNGNFPNCDSARLIPIELIPVYAPSMPDKPETVADLQKCTLIQSLARSNDWRSWFDGVRANHVERIRYMKFENSALCYEAAMEGIGVAMGIKALVTPYLASGKLIASLAEPVALDEGYYLVWPSSRPLRGGALLFYHWLLEEVAGETSPPLSSSGR